MILEHGITRSLIYTVSYDFGAWDSIIMDTVSRDVLVLG